MKRGIMEGTETGSSGEVRRGNEVRRVEVRGEGDVIHVTTSKSRRYFRYFETV